MKLVKLWLVNISVDSTWL